MKSGNSRIEELIERYQMGVTDEDEVAELEQALKENAGMREALITAARLDTILHNEALNAAADAESKRVDFPQPIISSKAVFAAAAVVALALLIQFQDNRPTGPDSAPSSALVARLVATVDADWRGAEPLPGAFLEAGSFQLEAGTVELEFNRGARVTLHGHSRFELKNADWLHVSSGNLVATIPEEAIGFTITTDQAEVVDLGTEFGLSVNDDGQTDVHVLGGLVEVLPRNRNAAAAGVMIAEGQARRFHIHHDISPAEIPVSSREALIGNRRYSSLGVRMLRGSVRMTDRLDSDDYAANTEGQHWISLIAEQQEVTLARPLETTLNAPGRFRKFGISGQAIPVGARVNSYLLHFRPSSRKDVRGVIRFEQPILGVLCNPHQLEESDPIFGISSIDYPTEPTPRGLEPGPYFDTYVAKAGMPADFQPDEVILSQDRSTPSIRASADPEKGYYDQVRILTLAPE